MSLGVIGIITGILAALVTTCYTIWKWRYEARGKREKQGEIVKPVDKAAKIKLVFGKSGNTEYIQMQNLGNGIASNVRLYLDDISSTKYPASIEGENNPIPDIESNDEVKRRFGFTFDAYPSVISVKWQNEDGSEDSISKEYIV